MNRHKDDSFEYNIDRLSRNIVLVGGFGLAAILILVAILIGGTIVLVAISNMFGSDFHELVHAFTRTIISIGFIIFGLAIVPSMVGILLVSLMIKIRELLEVDP